MIFLLNVVLICLSKNVLVKNNTTFGKPKKNCINIYRTPIKIQNKNRSVGKLIINEYPLLLFPIALATIFIYKIGRLRICMYKLGL